MAGSNFVDYVKIFARSGHGGAGSAHFRREKFVAFGGPDGGDGGRGGSIVLQGDSQYWTLIHLKYQRHQFAEDGEGGSGARSSGKDARDIVIPVPLGTVARRVVEQEDGTTLTEDVGEVTADGEQLVLLKGGRGGLGNWHFKSATNQTPRYAQPGEDVESAAVIVTVITINAILGTIQTVKAEQSLQSLKNLSGPEAKVLRDGVAVQLPARELVVGDVILLEAGDMIPADGRLIENASLKVDESALTGESLAVEKNMDTILTEAPLGDRANMLFSGSFVTYGRGKAVVTDIGMQTEVGKIAGLLKSTSEKQTPLQVSLEVFGKKLSIMILIFCGLLFAINVFRGEKISSAFMFAVALAVAAIPEALSSIVTIVLSFGTQKMAKEHAIIRKLQAVEGLGSVSIICSDKTGTLTQNKMTVEDYYIDGKRISAEAIDISDQAQKCLLNYSILCNDSTNENGVEIGDPTETALINLGSRYGVEAASIRKLYPRNGELPFDSD